MFQPPGNLCDVILIISDLVQPFAMFLFNFLSLLAYIGLIATSMDYLCIPHTIVYIFNVCPRFSNLFQSFPTSQFLIFQSFTYLSVSVDCVITIASDSDTYRPLVISDPSNDISTSLRSFLLIFNLAPSFYIE